MDRVLEVTPLAVGAGAVEADGVNVKHLGVFVGVLKYKEMEEVRVTDKVVEYCRCIILA